MSRKKSKLLPLCMLLLLAAGALMPYAVSSLQDYRLAVQTESRPLDGIEFTLRKNGAVEQTLEILSAGYTQIMLQEGNNLTQQEAETAANEAMKLLAQEALLPDFSVVERGKTPIVFAAISSSNRSESAIIWAYTFTGDGQSQCTIWIDDATKKLVYVSYVVDDSVTFMTSTVEHQSKSPERWAAFLQEYYGLESVAVNEFISDEAGNIFTLELAWQIEGKAVSCKLPLMFRGEDVVFGW